MGNSILNHLAVNNASFKPFETTTGEIAMAVKSSQQTVSRKLIQLEKEGWIIREATPKGMAITLTRKALSILKEDYHMLKSIFEPIDKLRGKLTTGIGEGRYYMRQQEYQVQFREKLGFFPWPGTLNIQVDVEIIRKFLITKQPTIVEGFRGEDRTFGGLWCYPVTLEKNKAAIIIPMRTTHPENIVEIIAPFEIRAKFGLKDGDEVKVSK